MELKSISLLDTLSGQKKILKPKSPGEVCVYCCGPTVYGYTHVGNARAALTLDLITRVLEYAGYNVQAARNFTDIDDKIIEAAKQEKITPHDLAKKYEQSYVEELATLGCKPPHFTPRATETIPEMIVMIEKLLNKKAAYTAKAAEGTDVYFRITSFREYGKLSKRKVDDMLAGARVEIGEQKEHPADFALWKAAKPGEPSWKSPWGQGRPGWHIECSAMIHQLFGTGLDIHMGGVDLVFPHHENEIAQSEACESAPLANSWLHNGLIEMGHEKMSKSLGNIVRTRQFLDTYGPEVLRLLVFAQHYRSPIDFSNDNVLRAEDLVLRLYAAKKKVEEASQALVPTDLPPELSNLEERIAECLFDDFNSARALGLILGALRVCWRENRLEYFKAWGSCLKVLNSIYGILTENANESLLAHQQRKLKRTGISEERAAEIESRLKERQMLRQQKKFKEADELRLGLEQSGILVMDSPEGSHWSIKE